MVRVELACVVIHERSDEQVILLREAEGGRELPIVIGTFEAFAIDGTVKERSFGRPLTHDLMLTLVRRLGGEVARIVIDDLREATYYAKVVVRTGKEELLVDARPSDAITLALKADAPIFVAERVLGATAG